MTYIRELDDLRQELRQDTTGVVTYWPKVDGENVVPSAASYTVYDHEGVLLQSATTATIDADGRMQCAVPAASVLAEDYRVDLVWTYSGTQTTDHVYYDVVLYPFGGPRLSLNDLLEERPDCGEVLERLGLLLGYTLSEAQSKMAAIIVTRAHVELDALLRQQLADHHQTLTHEERSKYGIRYSRPYLIINRERLQRISRKLAMQLLYESDMRDASQDSLEESSMLYQHYVMKTQQAWNSMGPLKFDNSENLIPDEEKTGIGSSSRLRRTQG